MRLLDRDPDTDLDLIHDRQANQHLLTSLASVNCDGSSSQDTVGSNLKLDCLPPPACEGQLVSPPSLDKSQRRRRRHKRSHSSCSYKYFRPQDACCCSCSCASCSDSGKETSSTGSSTATCNCHTCSLSGFTATKATDLRGSPTISDIGNSLASRR